MSDEFDIDDDFLRHWKKEQIDRNSNIGIKNHGLEYLYAEIDAPMGNAEKSLNDEYTENGESALDEIVIFQL